MNIQDQVKVNHYDFDQGVFDKIEQNTYKKDLWPVVYILSDNKNREAYIGETADTFSRMAAHLKHKKKSKLTLVHFISSKFFNKSATLDIESNLIKYMAGDGKFTLQNGNLGLANHNYYQKEELYWGAFESIWSTLRANGLTTHSLEHIDNSDLFKYSPYKSLSKDQIQGLRSIINTLLDDTSKTVLVEGGAGTGKTILAIFLFKLLNTDLEDFNFGEFGDEESDFITLIQQLKEKYPKPKMGLVIPMTSFRATIKNVFRNIKGLGTNMVIGPSSIAKEKYDILIIDEAHRLRRRVNLGGYFRQFDINSESLGLDKSTTSELDWINLQSEKAILFYDEFQSIKPSDVRPEEFAKLKQKTNTKNIQLKTQFRVKGGNEYVRFLDKILNNKLENNQDVISFIDYDVLLFDSLKTMRDKIKEQDQKYGLSRLVAGYSWPWKSKSNPEEYDIFIEDLQLRWNSTGTDWVNSPNAINEVGCIHTTQGYDLNYTGVIFGHEIDFDKTQNRIVVNSDEYHDRSGKSSLEDPQELHDYIINIYQTIALRGIRGTYIYVCNKNLRDYFSQFIPVFKEESIEKEITLLIEEERFENSVPIYDLKIAAGDFSEQQQADNLQYIQLPDHIQYSDDLFACQIVGESMNKVIPNGSICLFKKDKGGSRNGKIVLVSSTAIQESDFGSNYTIKEYSSKKTITETGWKHKSIQLIPLSYEENYEVIHLEKEELFDFKVIGVFECVLI